ncbi:inosose dehydratase [Dyadobacter sp. SG02]|uniref:sugar phosphate isomerase/epimerase family protein n=1 Tax=Dyadobacter sp. SG02 TaxID=1855291 RepID=UPI0008B3E999|nr:TIM barrel protein [Dyadobacter sp. SG02]SEI52502.1 inosose dehydratase [Dyadobacter sp. SG02]
MDLKRRDFLGLGVAAGVLALSDPEHVLARFAQKNEIGATFILWGYGADALEPSLQDMSKLGYHAFETFGHVIQEWEEKRGGFKELVQKHGVPIISAFCNTDVLDPSKTKDEVKKLVRWCELTKANGGKVIEYCPSGIKREGYDYKAHKQNLISSMNEYAKVVTDHGLVCALHPHTGTPIETEEEVYFVMENLDTRYMKFGPDVGQLEKGGGDPVKVVKDFLSLVEHVHLKDFSGGNDNGYLGYAPLGAGKVHLQEILTMLETRKGKMAGMVMFELDSDKKNKPKLTEFEAAKASRDYLSKMGYQFKV